MCRLLMFAAAIAAVACREGVSPPARTFTLGPGCWTREVIATTTNNGVPVTITIDGHFPVCPDPLPAGHVLRNWDTVWVSH